VLALLFVAELGWALARVVSLGSPVGGRTDGAVIGSVREMGRVLFTQYSFAFEATSILILVAMVGAVVLARRDGDA